jgi:competence protein ComEA
MKTWQAVALGAFLALICAGLIIIISSRPHGIPYSLSDPATPSPITVHVDGAVKNPGVYKLTKTSRVVDAIQVAGGLCSNSETENINLAAPLIDGSKIYIPKFGETLTPEQINTGYESTPQTISNISQSNPVNINTASQEELMQLPGIGPTKAEEIIRYRTEHGHFANKEDIMNVSGIGETTYNQIKELITVSP